MVENICALKKIKKFENNSQDIIFGDFPYALGSSVYIDLKDGKPKFKNAKDFQNKWDMPDHKFWEEFFKECNRVLKHGGRVLAYGIDRQLMLFNYYAVAAGLEIQQSLYWYFIQNFPKSVDLSKQIDKKLGNIRETIPGSKLRSKYEGYKYSISPLKQSLETIMVFQKPTKTNSLINDFILFSKGDISISPNIWNIDNNRTPVKDKEYLNNFRLGHIMNSSNTLNLNIQNSTSTPHENGRYPSQLFCSNLAANNLDQQSGILKSGGMKKGQIKNNNTTNSNTFNKYNCIANEKETKHSKGGCSKILHKIEYLEEELSLLHYNAKVSKNERNFGLDEENKHPTLKPIDLNKKIALLLKSPHEQKVFFPFAGTASEIIGFEKAGFDFNNFEASEISNDDTKIANQRILVYRSNLYCNQKHEKTNIAEVKEQYLQEKNLFDFV